MTDDAGSRPRNSAGSRDVRRASPTPPSRPTNRDAIAAQARRDRGPAVRRRRADAGRAGADGRGHSGDQHRPRVREAGATGRWIGGDNYGIGSQAGLFFADQLKDKGNVVEIQGIAGISVTDLRTQGFMDAIAALNIKVVASQPADFNADKGRVMETILQAQPEIDAVYTHDDDMAEGVVRPSRTPAARTRCSSPAPVAPRTP